MLSPRHDLPLPNPEDIVPYAIYNTHKLARKQMQAQREHVQHTTSFLERQAKRSLKELEHKEKSLVDFYKLKESRFQEMKRVNGLLRRKRRTTGRISRLWNI
jgi:hypothetical protein